jgi:transposase
MPASAALGAPQAINVADRFPILKNLTEALQLLLARSQEEIKAASQVEEPEPGKLNQPTIALHEWRPLEPAHVEKARLARRAGRHTRSEQVVGLQEQGIKPKEIAQRLGLSPRTVQRWLASGMFPEAKGRRKRQSLFDHFAPYVLQRWKQGERQGSTLLRELRQQGYQGSEQTIYRYLKVLKQAEVKASANPQRIQK